MNQSTCETKTLVEFLDGELSEGEVKALTKHLDGCTTCVEQLEKLAATPARWKDVKTHLSRTISKENPFELRDSEPMTLPFTIRQVVDMLDPTDDPNSMGRLGGYEIIGVVGSGAMGVVLKAVDPSLDRVVALKVMNPILASCGTARHRFAREAKAAAGVLHPNVIAIHSVSTDRELPYLVMPYIAGTSLQQRMDSQGPLALVEILRIGSQIAAGLEAAHQKGLIHRDIKPSNVMLDEGVENALITDFGLARTIDDATMTRSGAITGTPEYMSPEQARGDAVDCASDIFSLGSVLYALCSGTRPFRAKTPFGVLRKITDEEPTAIRNLNPDVPIWLCKLIARMHAKSPDKRPSSSEIQNLLDRCLAHVYQPDRIELPPELVEPIKLNKLSFSNPVLIGVFSIMTFVLISLVAATLQTGSFPGFFEASVATPKQRALTDKAAVFKTLNLDFPNPSQQGTLIVDINRGFIDVVAHDQPGVVIEILTPSRFRNSSQSNSDLPMIFAPKYDLDTDAKKNSIKLDTYNQDFVLNLRIKVPQKTNLSLDTYMDGYLKIKNVAGIIKTRSQHSDISLLNIAGTATGYSRNGNLEISFREVAANARLDFESYNGTIDLALPESIAASTAVAAGRGSYESAFKIESVDNSERPDSILAKVKSNVEEYQFGKINGGGIPLRIESENGRISIRKQGLPMP